MRDLKPGPVLLCLTTVLACGSQPVVAQDVYVFAANGQSDEQLAEDRYGCHQWAVAESGFNPSEFNGVAPLRTVEVPVPRNERRGATGKGALAGAVTGGIIGGHGRSAGNGAAIGAVLGTIIGAAAEESGRERAREQARSEARREAEEISQTNAQLALRKSSYRRAITACFEGRGYTVQ